MALVDRLECDQVVITIVGRWSGGEFTGMQASASGLVYLQDADVGRFAEESVSTPLPMDQQPLARLTQAHMKAAKTKVKAQAVAQIQERRQNG